MKKLFLTTLFLMLIVSPVFAYNPNSFIDEETLSVNGKRPKVDITLSAFEVTINAEDFIHGIAEDSIVISNDGNVPCYLNIEIQDVPIDLVVDATIDSDRLFKGESTNLNLSVELSDMQETESFTFTILIEARLRP